jgi:tetratricopeptide (TPR) repeat protein
MMIQGKTVLGLGLMICLLAVGPVAGAVANEPDELLREALQLMHDRKEQEALVVYEKVLELVPQQTEALSQASLLHARLGSRSADETTRTHHYGLAEKHAQKAMVYAPASVEANYAMASAYIHLSQIATVRQKLLLLREMKQNLDFVLAKNPLHAGAWHLLGRWHFRAANYNLSELFVTTMMMRGVAKDASNEAAIAALRQAIALDPHNIVYYHDLARVLLENKQTEETKDILKMALTVDLVTAEDLEVSRKCKAMLRSLKGSST